MTREQRAFLALLTGFIEDSEDAELPADLDWEKLYEIAAQQSLTGVCYVQLKRIRKTGIPIPDSVMEQFHHDFLGEVYFSANRTACLSDVSKQFDQEGVRFYPFKGWVVKDYWPLPELRSMGDLDLLIRPADRQRSDLIMKRLGYRKFIDNHAVWTYLERDIVFEIHDHMFYENLANQVDYRGYFDQIWDSSDPEWNDNRHFLYLMTHMAKHTINKGVGFRYYLDLVFFCRGAAGQLNWKWIASQLKKLQLYDYTCTCFAFCRKWFGVNMPLISGELSDSFYAAATQKMFRDGTFGLSNRDNEASISAKEMKRSRMPYWVTAIRLTLQKLFPSYEDMQLIPWYRFVDGRPWLMPAAWVYRWVYILRHKRKHGAQLLTEPYLKKTVIERREHLIQDWGL